MTQDDAKDCFDTALFMKSDVIDDLPIWKRHPEWKEIFATKSILESNAPHEDWRNVVWSMKIIPAKMPETPAKIVNMVQRMILIGKTKIIELIAKDARPGKLIFYPKWTFRSQVTKAPGGEIWFDMYTRYRFENGVQDG